MFEENQIKAWRSVTAPADLRERVIEAAAGNTKKAVFSVRKYAALAACAAIVICVSVFGYSQSAFKVESTQPVSVDMDDALSIARLAPQPIVKDFELDARQRTTASVSSGSLTLFSEDGELLCSGSSVAAKGKVLLRWAVDDLSEDHTLRLESGLKRKTVTLAYDPASEEWTTDLK